MKPFRNLAGVMNRQAKKMGRNPKRKRLLLKTIGFSSRKQMRF